MKYARYSRDEIGVASKIKYQETEEDLLREAENGDAWAQINLFHCYRLGSPRISRDGQKAIEWLTKAAEQGHANALFQLAGCHFNGECGLSKDVDKCMELVRAGFDLTARDAKRGDARAQVELGICHWYGLYSNYPRGVAVDKRKAFDWYFKAAKQDYPRAMFMVAGSYYDSYKCYKEGRDSEKAGEWYVKAADRGYARAQSYLGWIYSHGYYGVTKDTEKAIEWYLKAVDQGNTDAELGLGELYLSKDPGKAFEWLLRAAEEHWNVCSCSCARAQLRIAKCLMNGEGVPKDEKKTLEWLAKSAANGNEEAKGLLEKLKTDDAKLRSKSTAAECRDYSKSGL